MKEIMSALVGALVTGFLGVWLLPIWREAKRSPPQDDEQIPEYCRSNSLNRLVFNFFRWVYWGEVPLFKGLISVFERRLRRPRGTSSQMFIQTSGSVYHFCPIPTTMSLLVKIPYVFGALIALIFVWLVIVVPLIALLGGSDTDALAQAAVQVLTTTLIGGSALFIAIWLPNSHSPTNAITVLFEDGAIKLPPNLIDSIEKPPTWRINPSLDETFKITRLFHAITLVEISFDGGKNWTPACRPGFVIYKISRLVERNCDWQSSFAEFAKRVTSEAGQVAAGKMSLAEEASSSPY